MKRLSFFFLLCCINLAFTQEGYRVSRLFAQEKASLESVILENQVVHSVDAGRVIFSREANNRSFPSTLGNTAIILSDDGIQYVYGNIAKPLVQPNEHVKSHIDVALAGESGWCTAQTVMLQTIDIKNHLFINPLLFLPPAPDTQAPRIYDIRLVGPASLYLQRQQKIQQLAPGTYAVYAQLSDRWDAIDRDYLPLSVTMVMNGRTVKTVAFKTLAVHNARFHVIDRLARAQPLTFDEAGRFFLGTITVDVGFSELSFFVTDYAGNEKTVQFMLKTE